MEEVDLHEEGASVPQSPSTAQTYHPDGHGPSPDGLELESQRRHSQAALPAQPPPSQQGPPPNQQQQQQQHSIDPAIVPVLAALRERTTELASDESVPKCLAIAMVELAAEYERLITCSLHSEYVRHERLQTRLDMIDASKQFSVVAASVAQDIANVRSTMAQLATEVETLRSTPPASQRRR